VAPRVVRVAKGTTVVAGFSSVTFLPIGNSLISKAAPQKFSIAWI